MFSSVFEDLGSLRLVSADTDCRFILGFFKAFFKVFCVYAVLCFMLQLDLYLVRLGVPVLNKILKILNHLFLVQLILQYVKYTCGYYFLVLWESNVEEECI